jgi:hypothetical protein
MAWYEQIDALLRSKGMNKSKPDPNMYYMHQKGEVLILMIYVDDLFLTGSSETLISWIKHLLHDTFEMVDLGPVKRYLGITFEQTLLGIFLHQKDYANSIISEFGMAHFHPTKTPLPKGLTLATDTRTSYIDSTYYGRLVGKLIFLTIIRADIAFAVNRVASYLSQPQQAHLDVVMHILRYIRGTIDLGILYKAGSKIQILGFMDPTGDPAQTLGDPLVPMSSRSQVAQSAGVAKGS